MNDILFVGVTVLFFALSLGVINILDELREDKS